MITFKEGNLRIPKWGRRVFVVAGGTTAYKKYFPEYKLEELVERDRLLRPATVIVAKQPAA